MIIPAYQNVQFTDDKGNLTNVQQIWIDNLIQNLQAALSDDGWTAPQHTTAEITSLESRMPNGTIWFNSTLAKLQVKTASGVVETITSV